jgi:hypothetical protein
LAFGGELGGEVPDWAPLLDAAQVCHCPPWELLERETYWLDWALAYQRAHAWAADVRARRQQRAEERATKRHGLSLSPPGSRR